MRQRLWIIIFTIIVGSSLSIETHAEEDFYKIIKLVRLQDDKAEIIEGNVKNLVEIKDLMGRDRAPQEGVKEGDKIIFGRYVHCGPGIGIALQSNDNDVLWMNSDTTIQVENRYIKADKGEIYTSRAKRLKLEFADGTVIDPGGSELYLKAGKEESLLYLFEGRINIGPHTLVKQKPFARIGAGDIECLGSDGLSEDVKKRAEMWRKSIRRVTAPFWAKPKFYISTSLVVATAGIGTIIYYHFIRKPGVRVRIEMPLVAK